MKRIFLFLTLVYTTIGSYAQEGLVAALYHGDDFKIYYSSDALKNAMTDAQNGDIITLSPGTFEATTINKAITIRGAGIGAVDTLNNSVTPPTIIDNSERTCYINVPVDSISRHTLNIEGVIFNSDFRIENLSNAIISKTRLTYGISSYGSIDNVSFIQCIFDNLIKGKGPISIYNSVLMAGISNSSKTNINNCILYVNKFSSSYFDNNNITYNNCIFVSDYEARLYRSNCFNCLWVGKHNLSGAFETGLNTSPERQNKTVPDGEEIFIPDSFYKLNENGKKYLGSDGTEVGIYGGRLPFSTVTSYPQIKKFNVAPESTDEGKLKIEFEIQ